MNQFINTTQEYKKILKNIAEAIEPNDIMDFIEQYKTVGINILDKETLFLIANTIDVGVDLISIYKLGGLGNLHRTVKKMIKRTEHIKDSNFEEETERLKNYINYLTEQERKTFIGGMKTLNLPLTIPRIRGALMLEPEGIPTMAALIFCGFEFQIRKVKRRIEELRKQKEKLK